MLILPRDSTRAERRGFGLALALLLGAAALAAAVAGAGAVAAGPGVAALLALVAGLLLPDRLEGVYGAWNRAADVVARGGRLWISLVAYGIVAVVGLAGARLPRRAPGGSGWWPRPALDPAAYDRESNVQAAAAPGGWLLRVARWAREGRQAWVWVLLPFLALLRLIQLKPQSSLGGDTYTLY